MRRFATTWAPSDLAMRPASPGAFPIQRSSSRLLLRACCIIFAFSLSLSHAKSIYISTVGSDSNDGQIATPVASLAFACTLCLQTEPCDLILEPGFYFFTSTAICDVQNSTISGAGSSRDETVIIWNSDSPLLEVVAPQLCTGCTSSIHISNIAISLSGNTSSTPLTSALIILNNSAAVSLSSVHVDGSPLGPIPTVSFYWILSGPNVVVSLDMRDCLIENNAGGMKISLEAGVEHNISSSAFKFLPLSGISAVDLSFATFPGSRSGKLSISNVYLEAIKSDVSGAAVHVFYGSVKASSVECIRGSTGSSGSCFLFDQCDEFEIRDSWFGTNTAVSRGGCVAALGTTSQGSITNTTFNSCQTADEVLTPGDGGAVYAEGGLMTYNCIFRNNMSSRFGGAVFASGASTFNGTVFDSNIVFNAFEADVAGGAIASRSSLVVSGSTFTSNLASVAKGSSGGAISWEGPFATISDSTFSSNAAEGDDSLGGAIFRASVPRSTLRIERSSFFQNSAHRGGSLFSGVGYNSRALVFIDSCIFSNNLCFQSDNSRNFAAGGAIFTSGEQAQVLRSIFRANNALGQQLTKGGAVYSEYATIDDCQFEQNFAQIGGAVFLEYGSILSSSFIQNFAAVLGGATYLNTGLVSSCRFLRNGATCTGPRCSGGSIFCEASSRILDSVFVASFVQNPSHAAEGGAIFASGDLFMQNCTIDACRADFGGAVRLSGIESTLVNSTFVSNIVTAYGGAVLSSSRGLIQNCNFLANNARQSGGAIFAETSTSIYNSTFSENTAGEGAALCFWPQNRLDPVEITLSMAIISNNSSPYGSSLLALNNAFVQMSLITMPSPDPLLLGSIYVADGASVRFSGGVEGESIFLPSIDAFDSVVDFFDVAAARVQLEYLNTNELTTLKIPQAFTVDAQRVSLAGAIFSNDPHHPDRGQIQISGMNTNSSIHHKLYCVGIDIRLEQGELSISANSSFTNSSVLAFGNLRLKETNITCDFTPSSYCEFYAPSSVFIDSNSVIFQDFNITFANTTQLYWPQFPLNDIEMIRVYGGSIHTAGTNIMTSPYIPIWQTLVQASNASVTWVHFSGVLFSDPTVQYPNANVKWELVESDRYFMRLVSGEGSVLYIVLPSFAAVVAFFAILAFSIFRCRRNRAARAAEKAQMRDWHAKAVELAEMQENKLLFNIDIRDIEFKEKLGEGSFGIVFLAKYKNKEVAVKKLTALEEAQIQEFYRESALMMALETHENIVRFYGMCQRRGNLSMVMEYVPSGALSKLIESRPLERAEILKVALGTAKGMACLARQGIVHRDIAARNILLGANLEPKVADFGLARVVESQDDSGHTKSNVGPVKWMAPENFRGQYSEKSDVWAWACMIIEMVTRKHPWDGFDNYQVITLVTANGAVPAIPLDTPLELAELMALCWRRNVDDRPSFAEIVETLEASQGASGNEMDVLKANERIRQLNQRFEPPDRERSTTAMTLALRRAETRRNVADIAYAQIPPPAYESTSDSGSSSGSDSEEEEELVGPDA